MAKEQESEGAHALDVCTAFVGRNEMKDMTETIRRFTLQSRVPLMIDSTEAGVIEAAMKLLAGKPIVNSINLEDGEERMSKICPLLKTYGGAVVALTIDEEGMAKTADKKVAIAKRIHEIATREYGIPPGDLIGVARGVKEFGGILDHGMREVMVKCMPEEIPEALQVDVSNMEIGNSIHLSDIMGEYTQLEFLDDENVTLAHVSPPKKLEVFEEAGEAAEEAAGEEAEGEGEEGEQEAEQKEE